jgi:hypothetical protein
MNIMKDARMILTMIVKKLLDIDQIMKDSNMINVLYLILDYL